MVNLYAARHGSRSPLWPVALALGIVATLAANMAQGWSHGPVGAVIAAWPAVSLVGSYELLVWIIRTAAAGDLGRGLAADHGGPQAGHCSTSLRLAAARDLTPNRTLIGWILACARRCDSRFACAGSRARAWQADRAGTRRTMRTRQRTSPPARGDR